MVILNTLSYIVDLSPELLGGSSLNIFSFCLNNNNSAARTKEATLTNTPNI